MAGILDPFQFVLITLASWMNQRQLHVIDYLREENRVLREQLSERRLRLNDDQRHRLAAKAKRPGRTILEEIATMVTPDTLLAWHRRLIARKYDGSVKRQPGRPRKADEIEAMVVRMAEENRDWDISASKARYTISATISLGAQLPPFCSGTTSNRHRNEAEKRPGRSF